MIPQLRDPAVLINVLVRADEVLGAADSSARHAVEMLWARARGEGMTSPVYDHLPVTEKLELPVNNGQAGALSVLAAAQCIEPGLARQIIVYRQRDIVGINLLEAVQDGTRPWEEFDLTWLGHWTAGLADTVGAHIIHLGLVGGPNECLLPGLLSLLPDKPQPVVTWRPSPEQFVAELPPLGTERRLFATADVDHADLQSQWFTDAPHRGLPRFLRYLEHSSRLRYQARLLDARLADIRKAVAGLDRDATALHQQLGAQGPALDKVLHAEKLLEKVENGRRIVVGYLADVRAMATTVRIAEQNIAEVVGPERVAETDRDLGRWTLEQLKAEEEYLESVHLKAAEVGEQASAAVDETLQRGLDRVLLAQASVLSAIALAFTAAQTLEYKPPIPERTFGPLVALVAAVALALPVTVVRWWRGSAPNLERSIIDVVCATLTGAALAWLIETWCTGSQPLLAAGCAAAGGVLAGSVTWWRVDRLTRAAAATTTRKRQRKP
jgi:hypothetical protein